MRFMSLKIETSQSYYLFMEFSDNQNSDLINETNKILKTYPLRIVHLSIERLQIKIKPVSKGRKEF